MKKRLSSKKKRLLKEIGLIAASVVILLISAGFLWLSTLQLPDLNAFDQRQVTQSTKIYDRTGKVLLYDVHQDTKRTVVPFSNISLYIKNATVAIEDAQFYQHGGIRISSIIRAVFADALISLHLSSGFTQGGSTITQQVIKNSFLTGDRTITRKIKEWVLAIRLEQVLDKDSILGVYLNEVPYGGNIYGVEEAAQEYFGVPASDVTLAQAAYLAAIPQSPTYYSPNGTHLQALEERKNVVLKQMLANGFINQDQYKQAVAEKVVWNTSENKGIKAPHFVFFIEDYLNTKYGSDAVLQNGYKVITTLNYTLQSEAETIVKQYALANSKAIDAENAALVALDPKTGQILSMVGSRDYFDPDIQGNFNVALAHRQPGSSFKPFVYAEAFSKGYTPDTVVFDLPTEFSTQCAITGSITDGTATSTPLPNFPNAKCYDPGNYDGKFRGPMSLRNALAQSINIPAIKMLYLAGIGDSLQLAKNMGVQNLGDANQYGLTLVLGGGEVSLLDMTSAYGVFADEGVRNPYTGILEVDDKAGNVIESYQPQSAQVLDTQVARTINDVLSDNQAKVPSYGQYSPLFIPGYKVASKTGTTNDFRDVWVIGYTPDLAVGTWAGNNDNRPIMHGQTAGLVLAPMWGAYMQQALKEVPKETFAEPDPVDQTKLKPVLRGLWQGNQTYMVDKNTGLLATSQTPPDQQVEKVVQNVHDILYWVDKNDPLGPVPQNPSNDSQFDHWEAPVRQWALANGYVDQNSSVIPTQLDSSHTLGSIPVVNIVTPNSLNTYTRDSSLVVALKYTSNYPIAKAEYYLNSTYIGTVDKAPFTFSFIPGENDSLSQNNTLRVVLTDTVGNRGETTSTFSIAQ